MPDKENYNDSHDYFGTKRPYINSKPIHFKNGRHLLYLNKQHLWTPYIYSSYITLPFLYFAYLIKNNPCYHLFIYSLSHISCSTATYVHNSRNFNTKMGFFKGTF